MRRIPVALLVSLALGGTAFAAERAPQDHPDSHCEKIADIKAKNPKLHFEVLSPGAFHFAEGAYSILPPIGIPPGDGALLATQKGAHTALLIWTHKGQGCAPTPIPEEFAKLIPGIKTAPGEKPEPYDEGLSL